MKICTKVICTWSIKFTYKESQAEYCVASVSAGKLSSTIDRLKSKYDGFKLIEVQYFKSFIYIPISMIYKSHTSFFFYTSFNERIGSL